MESIIAVIQSAHDKSMDKLCSRTLVRHLRTRRSWRSWKKPTCPNFESLCFLSVNDGSSVTPRSRTWPDAVTEWPNKLILVCNICASFFEILAIWILFWLNLTVTYVQSSTWRGLQHNSETAWLHNRDRTESNVCMPEGHLQKRAHESHGCQIKIQQAWRSFAKACTWKPWLPNKHSTG